MRGIKCYIKWGINKFKQNIKGLKGYLQIRGNRVIAFIGQQAWVQKTFKNKNTQKIKSVGQIKIDFNWFIFL